MKADLIERLRNPMWSHTKHGAPCLDEETTLADMREAAAALEAEASEGERRGLERAAALVERGHANLGDYFARQMASRIRALITEAPAREGWQPIKTAPELDRVLVAGWQKPTRTVQGYWWMHEDVIVDGKPCDHPEALLWMPFPDPPPPSQDREPDSQRGAK